MKEIKKLVVIIICLVSCSVGMLFAVNTGDIT